MREAASATARDFVAGIRRAVSIVGAVASTGQGRHEHRRRSAYLRRLAALTNGAAYSTHAARTFRAGARLLRRHVARRSSSSSANPTRSRARGARRACLRFVDDAVVAAGTCATAWLRIEHNRRGVARRFVGPCALGARRNGRAAPSAETVGATRGDSPAADQRFAVGRAIVFAALGAADLLTAFPTDLSAPALLLDGV